MGKKKFCHQRHKSLHSSGKRKVSYVSYEKHHWFELIFVIIIPHKCSSAAAGGAIGGICHTFIIIETNSDTYILERLVEGVRLSNLGDDLGDTLKLAVCMKRSRRSISSAELARWVTNQAKQEYGLGSNNCIHFAYAFGQKFMGGALFCDGFLKFMREAMTTVGYAFSDIATGASA